MTTCWAASGGAASAGDLPVEFGTGAGIAVPKADELGRAFCFIDASANGRLEFGEFEAFMAEE